MSETASARAGRWRGAWVDLLAFAAGLVLAGFGRWTTTDLVWSLWLASLVVGYALIVWNLSANLREFAANAARDRAPGLTTAKLVTGGVLALPLLAGVAFFTIHFGGFHYVHSVFLHSFFPLEVAGRVAAGAPSLATYGEVIRQYWMFLPVAFIAERDAFRSREYARPDTAVTPEAIARRKRQSRRDDMSAPYRNVMRMHLLIFFFAVAHALRLENFVVYAVVYAVYFFPWRMLRRANPADT